MSKAEASIFIKYQIYAYNGAKVISDYEPASNIYDKSFMQSFLHSLSLSISLARCVIHCRLYNHILINLGF